MNKHYKVLDSWSKEYETNRPYKTVKIDLIINRFEWCRKFKKIDQKQIADILNRILWVQENCIY